MKVVELIERLKEMPQNAEVFYAYEARTVSEPDGLPGLTLFDIIPVYYPKVHSYGNGSPRPPSLKENVVVFEYD